MSWTRWSRWWRGNKPRRKQERDKRPRARLDLETLEDRTLFAVRAISLADPSLLSDTAAGNVQGPSSVSADGRYAVYTDTAAHLVPGHVMDSMSPMNVFLFDRQTGQTKLVSHAAGSPVTTAHGTSRNAAISADGNWVAYVSNSDNLVAGEMLPNDTYYVTLALFTGGTFTLTYG